MIGFERRVLNVCNGVVEGDVWCWTHKVKLCHLKGHSDIVKFIKRNRLRWIGHVEEWKKHKDRTIIY